MWRSVRQTPQAATRIRTWPGPGSGAGISRSLNGRPDDSSTAARRRRRYRAHRPLARCLPVYAWAPPHTSSGRPSSPTRTRRPDIPYVTTVYGIVKQSGGYIGVERTCEAAAPRCGSTSPSPWSCRSRPRPCRRSAPRSGSETILLVEDKDSVRALTRRILARAGYTVLTARDADEALRVSAQCDEPIELLLTDVIMAGLSGPRLAETLVGLRPNLGVLFMSGYNEDTIIRQGVLRQGVAYLQKPFTPSALTGACERRWTSGRGGWRMRSGWRGRREGFPGLLAQAPQPSSRAQRGTCSPGVRAQ